MGYLSKKLSVQDSHELEKMMADDDFMNDAVEGLEQINDTQKTGTTVEELNKALFAGCKQLTAPRFKRKFEKPDQIFLDLHYETKVIF